MIFIINELPLYKDKEFLYQKLIVEGYSTKELAEEIGCVVSTINVNLQKFGIKVRYKKWMKVLDKYGQEISDLYINEQMSAEDIGVKMGISGYIIRVVLKELNVKFRTKSEVAVLKNEQNDYRQYKLNEDYFKIWSSEMAYILGFIAADGCISTDEERCSYLLKITLKDTDSNHLLKIKNALDYEGVIYFHENNASPIVNKVTDGCTLAIKSKTLINDIKKIGIKERKSFNKEVPVSLPKKFEIDYIRGYFDGNGSVGVQYPTTSGGLKTKTTQIRVRFCSASRANLYQIQEILSKYGIKKKRVPEVTSKTAVDICYSTKESLILYRLFYQNKDAMYLDRKKIRFEEAITEREKTLMINKL